MILQIGKQITTQNGKYVSKSVVLTWMMSSWLCTASSTMRCLPFRSLGKVAMSVAQAV